jgi:hypothetical protein
MDGNGHYWPGQPQALPPGYYATPGDPLVSPNYEGWWQRGLALTRQTWKQVLTVQAIAALPMAAITLPFSLRLADEGARMLAVVEANPGRLPDMSGYFEAALPFFGLTLLTGLLSVVAMAVCVRLVVLAATGQPVSIAAAFSIGISRAPAVIGWGFLAGLVYVGAFLACFLPIIYVGAALMVLPVVVTLERGSGIGRCFALFHADIGTSVARVATLWGITVGSTLVAGVLGAAVEATAGGTAGVLFSTVLNGIAGLAIGIVVTPLLVTAYADMRSRREPFSTAYLIQPA